MSRKVQCRNFSKLRYMVCQFPHSQESACRQLRLGPTKCFQLRNVFKESMSSSTHVLSSSGSCSVSSPARAGTGRRTKLTFVRGTAGVLFISKYSINQLGIISSSVATSWPIMSIVDLYTGIQPVAASSEIRIVVSGDNVRGGVSVVVGGESVCSRSRCARVFGGGITCA